MDIFQHHQNLLIYYLFVTISLIYVIQQHRLNLLNFVIILIFYDGLFNYIGDFSFGKIIRNLYRVVIFILPMYYVLSKKLTHLTKLLNTYQARIKIANSRALEEKKRYELGNSQISFVISAQNNVHDVKLAYAQVATSYQKTILEYKATIDQLM